MALSIKSTRVERLLEDIVAVTGESKTEAVRQALEERRARLALLPRPAKGRIPEAGEARYAHFIGLLERDIWPAVPPKELGARPLTKQEEEDILGLGPEGV